VCAVSQQSCIGWVQAASVCCNLCMMPCKPPAPALASCLQPAACRRCVTSPPCSQNPHENWCTSCIQVSSSRGLVLAPFISSSCNVQHFAQQRTSISSDGEGSKKGCSLTQRSSAQVHIQAGTAGLQPRTLGQRVGCRLADLNMQPCKAVE